MDQNSEDNLISRSELFDILKQTGSINPCTKHSREILFDYVWPKIQGSNNFNCDTVQTTIKQFTCDLLRRWRRNRFRFKEKNVEWLRKIIFTPPCPEAPPPSTSSGRPKKMFVTNSRVTKRRKIQKLLKNWTAEELVFAAEVKYRSTGKRNIARAIKAATLNVTTNKTRGKKASPYMQKYTVEEALSVVIELKLTKKQYIALQKGANEHNVNLYPPYYLVSRAKELCIPEQEAVKITDTAAEVKLQSLLNHTASRLITVQKDIINQTLTSDSQNHINIIYKWGCDGSGGHSLYKQKFLSEKYGVADDSNILMTSLVPLQMNAEVPNADKQTVLWENPRTASTRFCRPIRFQFLKETTAATKEELLYIENQISKLTETKINSDNRELIIHHTLLKTMVDGKVCNSVLDISSSQVCYICKASPKEMNNLEQVFKRPCNLSSFEFGLSTLHARIRFFECVLHISYRLDIKKWQARGEEEKRSVARRKKALIEMCRNELGLLVDTPKQGGGTSNDGNTSRRFFKDPKKAAEITEINEDLITRFGNILSALSSCYELETESFRKYCKETADLFVRLYGWFYMPVTVHKILVHGADVIESMILPIGQLSEDALEARHKDYRYIREHNTRKTSRRDTNEDLLNFILSSSDPVISCLRKIPVANRQKLNKVVLSLIKPPDIPIRPSSRYVSNVSDSDSSETDSN